MDSDLAESVSALSDIFRRRKLPYETGKADPAVVDALKRSLRVPARYRAFLTAADPLRVETVCPIERVRLIPSHEVLAEQRGFALDEAGQPRAADAPGGWRRSWILVGRSTLLADPYFLDVSKLDAEGDCPVFTAMSGTDRWEPVLCATNFAMFLRILATGMELAQGFGEAVMDDEDLDAFRQGMAGRIKAIDPAALRAGHWT